MLCIKGQKDLSGVFSYERVINIFLFWVICNIPHPLNVYIQINANVSCQLGKSWKESHQKETRLAMYHIFQIPDSKSSISSITRKPFHNGKKITQTEAAQAVAASVPKDFWALVNSEKSSSLLSKQLIPLTKPFRTPLQKKCQHILPPYLISCCKQKSSAAQGGITQWFVATSPLFCQPSPSKARAS